MTAPHSGRNGLPRPSVAQRLLKLVRYVEATGCWEWLGAVSSSRQGHFRACGEQLAHRVTYRLWRGPIPDRFAVRQTCERVRVCVSPFHQEAVPWGVVGKIGAETRRLRIPPATHCKRGHELTPENTIPNKTTEVRDGVKTSVTYRLCRICSRDRHRRNYKRPAPKPPLPADENERYLERDIRRIINTRVADRVALIAKYLGCPEDQLGRIEVRYGVVPGELYDEYVDRTEDCGWWSEWYADRLLGDGRIARFLNRRFPGRVKVVYEHIPAGLVAETCDE